MKIIHCSDIHLDSKMDSNLPAEKAKERSHEICGTFARMAAYAAENQVRAVMICGDLFDTKRVSQSTADFILSAIEKAEAVDFLYLCGNHDESSRAFAGRRLPKNLKTFSRRWQYYSYDFVRIAGVELDRDNSESIYQDLSLPAEDINIVMLHGQTAAHTGEDLISLPLLRGRHIHYLALGHLHSFQTGQLDPDGSYAYCGSLEGRGFDECGEKGFVLLETDGSKVNSRFIPFALRQLHDIPVDITGLVGVSKIQAAMEAAGAGIDAKDLVKYTLRGTYTPKTQKDLGFLQNMLETRHYFVKIKDESRLAIEKESYEHDISLKGEFIRLVMASDKSPEEKEKIICLGIQALSGEEVVL